MKKYLLLLIFLPAIAHASWWNPFSWFPSKTPVIKTTTVNHSKNVSSTPITNTSSPKKASFTPPINVTRTVTNRITDPILQSQINTLIQENNSLRTKVDDLQNVAVSKNTPTTTNSSVNKIEVGQIKNKLVDLDAVDNKIETLSFVPLRDLLDTYLTLDGNRLFDVYAMHQANVGLNQTFLQIPNTCDLHRVVDNYRIDLKIRLTNLGEEYASSPKSSDCNPRRDLTSPPTEQKPICDKHGCGA